MSDETDPGFSFDEQVAYFNSDGIYVALLDHTVTEEQMLELHQAYAGNPDLTQVYRLEDGTLVARESGFRRTLHTTINEARRQLGVSLAPLGLADLEDILHQRTDNVQPIPPDACSESPEAIQTQPLLTWVFNGLEHESPTVYPPAITLGLLHNFGKIRKIVEPRCLDMNIIEAKAIVDTMKEVVA